MDKAYVQAEAILNDDAARAARRARILAAVADEAASPSPPVRRSAWSRGGWLAAACVAGLTVLVTVDLYRPTSLQQPATPPAAPEAFPAAQAPAPPIAQAPKPAPRLTAPQAGRAPSRGPVSSAPPPPAPEPAPEARAAAAPAAPAPAPPPQAPAQEVVVTSQRRAADVAPEDRSRLAAAADAMAEASAEKAASPAGAAPRAEAPAPVASARPGRASDAAQVARLQAAAEAGRTAEVATLLEQGVPVDARDDKGETALMKAVRGNHPAAAALLHRRGASLELENRAGVSARDMATSIGDADLTRALGLGD